MRALLVLLLLFPVVAQAAAPDDVAATFVEILLRDTPTATAERVITNEEDPDLLFDLRDLTDRHDRFAVRRHSASVVRETADTIALRIEIDATGTLKGKSRRAIPLFTLWHVEAKRDGEAWKIVVARTEERRIAESMVAALSAQEAGAILAAATHVDRIEAIELYSDELRQAKAVERLEHALSLALATGDHLLETFVRRAQLIAADAKHDAARMRVSLEHVEKLTGAGESPDVRLNAWFTIGLGYVFFGEVDNALPAYRQATELAEEVDDPVRAIKSQQMHTWLLSSAGRLTHALESAGRFAQLAAEFGWEEGEVVSLFNYGGLHDELGNHEYARDVYLSAARLARERGQRRLEASALFNAARDEIHLANYENAAALLQTLFHDVDREILRYAYNLAARAAMHRGRFEEADQFLRAGENLSSGEGMAGNHAKRSELHLRAGRTGEALDSAFRALAAVEHWATSADMALSRVEVLFALARALRASGRRDEAVERLREAMAIVDDTGERILAGHARAQIGMIDAVRGTYETAVELLVERGEPAESLRVAEQLRARGLRALLARGHVDLSASMSAAERAREEALDQGLVELNRAVSRVPNTAASLDELKAKIAVARRELDAYRTELRLAYPAMARRRMLGEPSIELPASWGGIAVVEYVVTQQQTIAFVVTHDQKVRAVRLAATRAEVAREARHFSREIAGGSLTWRTRAKRLHQMLLAPLEPYLGDKTLCIIPDVELWTVPFHALVDRRGRYVVDRRAVFYAHSLSLARDASVTGGKRGTLLAFGNPTMGAAAQRTVASAFRDVTLGSLIDAETEVRSLAKLYTPDRSSVYYRDEAREAVFKREAPEYRVIHVAAHAIVDDGAPLYSAIALAPGRDEAGEDGLLEAREIADLPLSADLAVLSACETARGKVGAGEGVVGLAWAFFAAGCSTTVVSQWNAESRATSQLMIDFHRRLLAGDSPAAALRTAQISLRRNPKYRHPFFWAPFVAIGAANRPALR